MAEACYTARATTNQQVINGINKLSLQTNEHGQYTHDAILLLQKGIQHVLISQFNPSDPGKGMVKLLDDGDNILTRIQSTDGITAGSVLKSAKKRADDIDHDQQNRPPYLHLTTRGTGGSQPIERHQPIRHWRKRRCCRGRVKTSRQQYHRHDSMNSRRKRF